MVVKTVLERKAMKQPRELVFILVLLATLFFQVAHYAIRPVTTQKVNSSGTSAQSAAFGANIEYLGLNLRYNPANEHWFIGFKDNLLDLC